MLILLGFPGSCSCCPVKHQPSSSSTTSTNSDPITSHCNLLDSSMASDPNSFDSRSNSVAELRRKAQEHSAAWLHSLHAAAAAGLTFPGFHFPPLSLHQALSNRGLKNGHDLNSNDMVNNLSKN